MELGWLVENHYEETRYYFETMSSAVMFGQASANKGKKYYMFEKPEKKAKKVSDEEKNEELSYLDNVFADF